MPTYTRTSLLVMSLWLALAAALVADEKFVESQITDSDREHWAFQPVKKPPLPAVKDAAWQRTGVDAFILARLDKKGLVPAHEADRATLLRRLSFDLTGRPPSPEELEAFQNDDSPSAYERLVNRLLASPAYGERWALHWLDLARFAETDGFEHDKTRPDAWRYRDWVIEALNSDLPYDEFIALQLAADEMPGTGVRGPESGDRSQGTQAASSNQQSAIPTMFCLAGPDMPDVNDQAERRHHLLNEVTSTVGSVLLGLQFGCAQCHDHKYDPISQADFYRLRAVFEPAVPLFKRDVPYNMFAMQTNVPPARLWIRGDHRRPGPEVQPAYPRIASAVAATPGDLRPPLAARRLDFAQWLFRDDNPLTARVIVNRVWQHHFGRGIFETPSDAGLMGVSPTHEDLLDWLAIELRDSGWSLKHLHRTIVCSATYRQASRAGAESAAWKTRLAADPENLLYSRFPRRRLEGEAIRDAMLASAGLLSAERGGPGVMPPLPPDLVNTLLKGHWVESPREAEHYRASIYIFSRRNLRYPLFEAFDRPDANASCPVRGRSTTAPQSLVFFNGEFSLLVARHLAGRIVRETAEPGEQARQFFRLALSREPLEREVEVAVAFLSQQREQLSAEARAKEKLALPADCPEPVDIYAAAALVDACLAIMNSSEFIYVD